MTEPEHQELIAEFLHAVVGESGLIEIRAENGRQQFLSGPREAASCAQALSDESEGRVWFGIAPRVPGTTRGRAKDCYTPKCFFADIDSFPEWDAHMVGSVLEDAKLPEPSFVVASGGGHHLYWLHDGDISRDLWKIYELGVVRRVHRLIKRLETRASVDLKVRDVARVMQVPYILNRKYSPPRLSRVLESESSERVYSIDTFRPIDNTDPTSEKPEWWNFVLPDKTREGERDEHIVSFACRRMVRDNAPFGDVVIEARRHFCDPSTCDPPVENNDLMSKLSRQRVYNEVNKQARESEQAFMDQSRGLNTPPPVPVIGKLTVDEVANRVFSILGDRIVSVDGMGLLIYSESTYAYEGSAHNSTMVDVVLRNMGAQDVEYADSIMAYEAGSRRARLELSLSGRVRRLEPGDVSSEWGLIPTNKGEFLNIRTGEITKPKSPPVFDWRSPVDADEVKAVDGEYGAWGEFVESTFPNPEYRDLAQRLAHYIAIGGNPDRIFIIAHGPSASGKNLFFNAVSTAICGEPSYLPKHAVCRSRKSIDDTVAVSSTTRRLIALDEINRGDKLDHAKVKSITSGDGVTVRAAYARKSGNAKTRYVMALLCNVMPELDEPDEAILNRAALLPFEVGRRSHIHDPISGDSRPKIDVGLPSRIESEDVLAWIMDGGASFRDRGLRMPRDIADRLRVWNNEADVSREWLEENLRPDPSGSGRIRVKEIFDRYCTDTQESPRLIDFKRSMYKFFDQRRWEFKRLKHRNMEHVSGILYSDEEYL